MNLKTYILFAFILYHAISAYSSALYPTQSFDLEYVTIIVEAGNDFSETQTASFQSELNEEDDAKECHYLQHASGTMFNHYLIPTNGKISSTYIQRILEPPCTA